MPMQPFHRVVGMCEKRKPPAPAIIAKKCRKQLFVADEM